MTQAPDAAVVDAVFGASAHAAHDYAAALAGRGIDWGLIGPREVERLWQRHIFNSAAHAGLFAGDSTVVDVGAGAGLPGIPLALARADLRITLLEPLERRCEFLTLVVGELGLEDRVRVVRARSEEHHETYDAVTSRAVAPLRRLLPEQWHLRASGGIVLALKGSSAAVEIDKARRELARVGATAEVLSVRAHESCEATTVVRVSAGRDDASS